MNFGFVNLKCDLLCVFIGTALFFIMDNNRVTINSSVLLKVVLNDPYKVELVDNLIISPELKAKALIPYLNTLFNDLSHKEETKEPKVPRYELSQVIEIILSICYYQD